MNYRAVGSALAASRDRGMQKSAILGRLAGILRKVHNRLPAGIARIGAGVQSGIGNVSGKLGFKDFSTKMLGRAEGAKQLLNLGSMNPRQLEFLKTMRAAPGALGQAARGQGKALTGAFGTGLGALGVGGMAAHDLATGSLLGGNAKPPSQMQGVQGYY